MVTSTRVGLEVPWCHVRGMRLAKWRTRAWHPFTTRLLVAVGLAVAHAAPTIGAGRTEPVPREAIRRGETTPAMMTVLSQWQPDRAFEDVIGELWEASPTFRRQCRRLSVAAPALRVHVRLEDPTRGSSARARASVEWRGGSIASAAMFIPVSLATPELIAHELEHVLEQIDRVDFEAHLHSGMAWRHAAEGFETQRAIEAGRRVAREVSTWRTRAATR